MNPIAGKRGRRRAKSLAIRRARTLAKSKNYTINLLKTQYAGHASILAKQEAAHSNARILALGGDGTINETAQGLIGSQCPLAIIPMGSGNGLARHLHIPLNPTLAIDTALSNPPIEMDYGSIDGHPFFTTAGIGLDAEVGWAFSELAGRGMANYIRATTELYFKYKPKEYQLTVDGIPLQRRALMITFANANQFGNNARIAPEARINDGWLELVIVRPFPKVAIGPLAAKLLRGTINRSPWIESFKFKHASIVATDEIRGHVDGEPIMLGKQFEVSIVPNALRIIPGSKARELSCCR